MELSAFAKTNTAARLRAAASRGALSHALILSGAGDRNAAAHYAAAALECTGTDKPCLTCAHCRKVLADIHPDVLTVRDDEHAELSVDVIRGVRTDAFIRPNEGACKVYIFPDCTRLNEKDQNVLLKTVEEGPPYAAFLFCAENASVLLPTIRSRCVEVKLPPAGTVGEDDERTRELLRLIAEGRAAARAAFLLKLETAKATREELAALAHSRGLPFFEDLGSGSLFDLEAFGIHGEPTLQGSVRAGADAVTCSGDKLLGGPQAGILVGKKSCLDVLKRHPLLRALRVDKMTLAALEATLRAYADGSAVSTLPTLAMLAASPEELRAQARTLCEKLTERGISAEVLAEGDAVGGGSVPAQTLPGFAAAVTPRHCRVDELAERLRQRETPVVARIAHERLLLCLRTLRPEEYDELVRAVAESDR